MDGWHRATRTDGEGEVVKYLGARIGHYVSRLVRRNATFELRECRQRYFVLQYREHAQFLALVLFLGRQS
jgi:hypothetical protein